MCFRFLREEKSRFLTFMYLVAKEYFIFCGSGLFFEQQRETQWHIFKSVIGQPPLGQCFASLLCARKSEHCFRGDRSSSPTLGTGDLHPQPRSLHERAVICQAAGAGVKSASVSSGS